MAGRSVGDGLAELAGAVGDVRDELARRRRLDREALDETLYEAARAEPRRCSAVLLAHAAVPGMLGRMFQRVVPSELVTGREDGSGVVSCPCGVDVAVGADSFEECSCERFYLWHRGLARVYNPALPVEAAA